MRARRPRPRTPLMRDIARAVLNHEGYRRDFAKDTLFRVLPKIASHVGVEGTDGIRYFVSTSDTEVGRTVFVTGGFTVEFLDLAVGVLAREGLLRVEGVFVDVGAHIGTMMLPALRRHGFARGFAMEPDPANADLLDINLVANRVSDRVTVRRAAATSTDGDVVLEHDRHNTGDHRVRTTGAAPGDYGEEARATINVEGRTLDGALADAGISSADVSVLWMDVQGHEAHVLAGATGVMAAGPPIVLEYWPYGLARANAPISIVEQLAPTHPTFVDLRDADRRRSVRFAPTSELEEVVRLGPEEQTDLLFIPARREAAGMSRPGER